MIRFAILGSTGSIGTQTLEVIDAHPDRFRVVGLSAGGGNLDLLVGQAHACTPDVGGVPSAGAGGALEEEEMEDEAVVMSEQRGLRSRFYQHGRYSPTRELGVHQFHRLVGMAMGPHQPALAEPQARVPGRAA